VLNLVQLDGVTVINFLLSLSNMKLKKKYELKSLKSVYSVYTPKTVVIGVTGGGGGSPSIFSYLKKMLYWLMCWRRQITNWGDSEGRDFCILMTGSNNFFPLSNLISS
jgi:hypothetical protein